MFLFFLSPNINKLSSFPLNISWDACSAFWVITLLRVSYLTHVNSPAYSWPWCEKFEWHACWIPFNIHFYIWSCIYLNKTVTCRNWKILRLLQMSFDKWSFFFFFFFLPFFSCFSFSFHYNYSKLLLYVNFLHNSVATRTIHHTKFCENVICICFIGNCLMPCFILI